jgi:hypothetical protein
MSVTDKLELYVVKAVFSFIIGKLYVVNLPSIFVIVKQQLISNHLPGSNIWFESGCAERCRTFIVDVPSLCLARHLISRIDHLVQFPGQFVDFKFRLKR